MFGVVGGSWLALLPKALVAYSEATTQTNPALMVNIYQCLNDSLESRK